MSRFPNDEYVLLSINLLYLKRLDGVSATTSDATADVSITFPSFNQVTDGLGFPRGGKHFNTAVPPRATLVSTGIKRKSSRNTGNEKKK